MSDPILYSYDNHIVTLTLNRHETRNAISDDEMIEAIEDACKKINADHEVRVVILTAVVFEPAFCFERGLAA